MASKRRLRRRSCTSKQSFDHPGAIRVAGMMRAKFKGYPYSAYKCQFCGGWHIGTPNRKMLQSMAASK